MIEREDPLLLHLTHKFRVFKRETQLRKWANKDSLGATKRADSRWLSSRDSKTRIPGRLRQKKYSKVEWNDRDAKRRNLSCSSRRRTTSTRSSTSSWTVTEAKLGSSWSSWEKPQWNGRIEAISRLNIRHNCQEKIGRRSRYYPWTHWQDTGITEWNQLHERFERFSRCWISTQWTFPRCQSTSVLPTSSSSWWNAKPFFWECRAATMGRQAFGTHMVYRESFLQIQPRLLQHFIRRNWIHGVLRYQNTHHHMWWVKAKHLFRIRDANQDRQPKIQSSLVREIFQIIMGQTNNDCRSQIFILTNSRHQPHVCLWEYKIQDWGTYLFAICYGNYAVDQRSGDGWFSGWF